MRHSFRFVFLLVILAGMLYGFINLRETFNEGVLQDREARQRFMPVTFSHSLNIGVKETYCPPKVRCGNEFIYVILEDSSERSFHIRRELDSTGIKESLRWNSWVQKKADNDTLIVFPDRNSSHFRRFILTN